MATRLASARLEESASGERIFHSQLAVLGQVLVRQRLALGTTLLALLLLGFVHTGLDLSGAGFEVGE